MSNVLTKDLLATVGEFGGTNGSPGFPAWDEYQYRYIYPVVGWNGTTPIYGPPTLQRYVIHHDAIPAVPATNGTVPQRENLYRFGWNAGAQTVDQSLTGDGMLQFRINPNSVGIIIGFGNQVSSVDYHKIDYSFFFFNDRVTTSRPDLSWVSADPSVYGINDVFTLRRLGREVAFYENNALIYRSPIASTGTLYCSVFLFAAGNQVIDAKLLTTVTAAFAGTDTGTLAVSLPVVKAWMAADDGTLRVTLPILTASLTDAGRLTAIGPIPTVRMLAPDFAGIRAFGAAIAVSMEGGLLTPNYGILQAATGRPVAQMYGSSDAEYPRIAVNLPKFKSLMWTGGDGILQVKVPQITAVLFDLNGFNFVTGTLPRMSASLDGQVLPDYFNLGVRATMPRMTAKMYGGGRVRAKMPRMTAALVATTSNFFTVRATLPRMTAALVVKVGSDTMIAARMPRMTARMYGGARIVATMPAMTAAVIGQSGTVVAITATAPRMTAVVSGYAGMVVTISATLPAMTVTSSSYIAATMPRMIALFSSNDASYVITDAYTVTLNSELKPVTRYTNYPFHSVVRRGNQLLGFGPNGVFDLVGDNDNGVDIAWSFGFGPTVDMPGDELGAVIRKTNDGAYLNGRMNGTVQLDVQVDDGTTYSYTKAAPVSTLNTMRFPVGLGLRGMAWRFAFSGTGPMTAYRAEFLQRSVERKIRYG